MRQRAAACRRREQERRERTKSFQSRMKLSKLNAMVAH
jgi:hypothetical protein